MKNQTKKLLSLVAAATMLASTLAATACGGYSLKEPLSGTAATDVKAESNGGFAVKKGDYIYFINGAEDYTADNSYGDVVKGSLMRIKADMSGEAEVVIPALVGSQNFETGIYIYGDYVYYAAPTTDKNIQGVVENSWIDFKRAKLDGSDTMSDYYFRLSSNSTNFRFVEEGDTVYCLYEEDSMLKSFNTKTRTTTVLAKGAGTFYFDKKDVTSGTVYYTMGVTYDIDSSKSTAAPYNQIYKVNASATATVNAKEASYTVYHGDEEYRTYDFDKDYLEEVNEEAENAHDHDHESEVTYDFNDYSTYPYVNLGELVVDGIGKGAKELTPYNDIENTTDANDDTIGGYKYTITRNENGGVYYTREGDTKLYFYDGGAANTVAANKDSDTVALNTTKASASAIMNYDEETGTHQYIYLSGSNIYRATAAKKDDAEGLEAGALAEDIKLCGGASSKTLWKVEGEYLYYYGSGSNGNALSRIKYDGDADDYHEILNLNEENKEFRPLTIDYVDFAASWYKPEIFGNTLLYANSTSIGSTYYNYIYKTTLDTATVEENNEKYEALTEYLDSELTVDMKNAATYLYRTYKRGVENGKQNFFVDYQEAQDEYYAKNDKEISWIDSFEEKVLKPFLEKNEEGEYDYAVEEDYIQMIGAISEDDEEAMRESWKANLPYPAEEEEDDSLPWWAITLIVVGSVLVVAAAVTVPCIMIMKKKKAQAEADATVNAYKTKIDTTDDKSIDVYADETPAEEVEGSEAE